MAPPDRLINAASPQLRAFQARAPLLSPQQRLPSALIAAGLGVFSSQTMVDLYSAIYDSTDPGDLADTDAWQLRQAFVGKDEDTRLAAIRKLLGDRQGRLAEGSGAGARRSRRDPDHARRQARQGCARAHLRDARRRLRPGSGALDPGGQWMDDEDADRCWAMLALAAPEHRRCRDGPDHQLHPPRQEPGSCAQRACWSRGLPGLAGSAPTPPIRSIAATGSASATRPAGPGSSMPPRRGGQAGTVLVLTGTGFQTPSFDQVPSAHLYHAVAALDRDRAGFHGANDRRRGAVTDVSRRT